MGEHQKKLLDVEWLMLRNGNPIPEMNANPFNPRSFSNTHIQNIELDNGTVTSAIASATWCKWPDLCLPNKQTANPKAENAIMNLHCT